MLVVGVVLIVVFWFGCGMGVCYVVFFVVVVVLVSVVVMVLM